MTDPRPSEQIQAELDTANARYREINTTIERLQTEINRLREEREALLYVSYPNRRGGTIGRLENEIHTSLIFERWRAGRMIRLVNHYMNRIAVFKKITPRRIFLAFENGRTEQYRYDGTCVGYGDAIHPDDLALILAGKVEELPLVKDQRRDHDGGAV